MDVLVVAGEASGDRHAAGLVTALRAARPDLTFFGMGGPALEAAGVELLHGSHELSVMGFTEVLPRLPRLFKVRDDLLAAAKARAPKLAILVDVPDFNFRLAPVLKEQGVKIAWYVAPMAWAWRESRVKQLRAWVDHLLCILPFEEAWFRERGVNATFVGNPLVRQLPAPAPAEHFRQALGFDPAREVLAVLPGSRPTEISRIAPTLGAAAAELGVRRPGLQVVVPLAPGLPAGSVQPHFPNAVFVDGRAAEVVGASSLALVASGTATLEAALMERPLVCVYKMSWPSAVITKAFLKIPYVSLVNLLAQERLIPELLQHELTVAKVVAEAERLWDPATHAALTARLRELRSRLGEVPPSVAVELLLSLLRA